LESVFLFYGKIQLGGIENAHLFARKRRMCTLKDGDVPIQLALLLAMIKAVESAIIRVRIILTTVEAEE
jgi:hypothetical protein